MTNEKGKEPAPSANDASSNENQKNYLFVSNDNTEKAKCQEAITAALDTLDGIYCSLSEKEQNIWNSGITYKRLLDVQQMIEENDHDRH